MYAFSFPSASISLLVPPDGLDRANGLREFSDGISQLIVRRRRRRREMERGNKGKEKKIDCLSVRFQRWQELFWPFLVCGTFWRSISFRFCAEFCLCYFSSDAFLFHQSQQKVMMKRSERERELRIPFCIHIALGMRMKGKGVWSESTAAWRFVRTEHPELMWVTCHQTSSFVISVIIGTCFTHWSKSRRDVSCGTDSPAALAHRHSTTDGSSYLFRSTNY